MTIEEYNLNPNICKYCWSNILYLKWKLRDTINKKFCNMNCHNANSWKEKRKTSIDNYYKNPNICLECWSVIEVKTFVHEARWKRFCNQVCSWKYFWKLNRAEWDKITKMNTIKDTNLKYLNGIKVNKDMFYCPSIIKRVLVEEFGHKCMNCGLSKWLDKDIPLELHHEDGDCKNNLITNLKLLCPNCHTFTDNYKSKNKKSTRNRKWWTK